MKTSLRTQLAGFMAVICTLFLTLAITQPAFATDTNPTGHFYGLSTTPPTEESSSDIGTYGLNIPTVDYNVAKHGRYNFGGWGESARLYTNYRFTGKTSYFVSVNNRAGSTLRVLSYRYSTITGHKVLRDVTIQPNMAMSFSVSAGSGDKIFLGFQNANGSKYYEFSGYIQ